MRISVIQAGRVLRHATKASHPGALALALPFELAVDLPIDYAETDFNSI